MVQPNQYSLRFLSSCKTIENENIQIKPHIFMKTQIGIIKCLKTFSDPRMQLLLDIIQLPTISKSKTMTLCDNKVSLHYISSEMNDIDVIIIPNHLQNIWDEFLLTYINASDIYIMKSIQDIINLHEINRKIKMVILNDHIIDKAFISLIANRYNIRKLILDACDDITLPKELHITYQFMWIVSFGFLDKYESFSKNRKIGFLKNVVKDLYGEYAEEISKKITINIEDKTIVHTESLVKSKFNSYTNIMDALKDEDISYAVCLINPLIFYTNESAYNHILTNVKSTINQIDTHMNVIDGNNTERILGLTQKKRHYREIYDSCIHRLENSKTCNICIDDIENKTILKCCKTSFCFRCINTWLQMNNRCPICKTKLKYASDQILIPEINMKIGKQICSENSIYQNFIILVKELLVGANAESKSKSKSILIYYTSKFILNLLKAHQISYQTIRNYQHESNTYKISVVTNPIIGCGMKYTFDHLILVLDQQRIDQTKLINIFKPKKVWYICNES